MEQKQQVVRTDQEWKSILTQEEYKILREKGTEARHKGYTHSKEEGQYHCKGCDAPLFDSTAKFDSGCGWPAFEKALPGAVMERPDPDGHRTEIVCAKCECHLGHVFRGERMTKTDTRHCVNSVCVRLDKSQVTKS